MRRSLPSILGLLASLCAIVQSSAQETQEPRFEGKNVRIERDLTRPGNPVVRISFGCHSDAKDGDLEKLKAYPQLREVDILSENITDEGLEHLKALAHLDTLKLNSSAVTNCGLRHVASLCGLRNLVLMRSQITPEGLRWLKKAPSLRELCLIRIPITSDGT